MEDDSGERIILSCILEIPEIKVTILKYFHRNLLDDIQAVLSLQRYGDIIIQNFTYVQCIE